MSAAFHFRSAGPRMGYLIKRTRALSIMALWLLAMATALEHAHNLRSPFSMHWQLPVVIAMVGYDVFLHASAVIAPNSTFGLVFFRTARGYNAWWLCYWTLVAGLLSWLWLHNEGYC